MMSLLIGLALAGVPQASEAPAAAPQVPVEEKKICIKQNETGSLIKGKKICRTAKQWAQAGDNGQSRDEVERSLSMGSRSGQ